MVSSKAATVEEYLAELPEGRREAIEAVRKVILDNLASGFEETMNWGMICYEVPLSIEPDTYNGKPLMYAALASQKNHMAVYLTGVYADEATKQEFVSAWEQTGKRVDMGKSCVRFRKLDDLPLDTLGDAIAAFDVDEFVSLVAKVHGK